MSKGITRYGDKSLGHDNCKPVPWSEALSSTIFVNTKSIGLKGTKASFHGCRNHSSHKPIITSGSATVFGQAKAIARKNDSCSCNDKVNGVSSNVFAS